MYRCEYYVAETPSVPGDVRQSMMEDMQRQILADVAAAGERRQAREKLQGEYREELQGLLGDVGMGEYHVLRQRFLKEQADAGCDRPAFAQQQHELMEKLGVDLEQIRSLQRQFHQKLRESRSQSFECGQGRNPSSPPGTGTRLMLEPPYLGAYEWASGHSTNVPILKESHTDESYGRLRMESRAAIQHADHDDSAWIETKNWCSALIGPIKCERLVVAGIFEAEHSDKSAIVVDEPGSSSADVWQDIHGLVKCHDYGSGHTVTASTVLAGAETQEIKGKTCAEWHHNDWSKWDHFRSEDVELEGPFGNPHGSYVGVSVGFGTLNDVWANDVTVYSHLRYKLRLYKIVVELIYG